MVSIPHFTLKIGISITVGLSSAYLDDTLCEWLQIGISLDIKALREHELEIQRNLLTNELLDKNIILRLCIGTHMMIRTPQV